MMYEPTNWQAGDVVTSAKLNKLEQGVANGGGILIVHQDEDGRLDKTWQEIHDADICYIISRSESESERLFVDSTAQDNNKYLITLNLEYSTGKYVAASNDDYPVWLPTPVD